MAGTHITGPLVSEGAITSSAGLAGTTVKGSSTVASATGFNFNIQVYPGNATSTLVISGMAAADLVKSAYKMRAVTTGAWTISNLTSFAVPASGSCTFTGKPLTSCAVLVAWVDVSQAS